MRIVVEDQNDGQEDEIIIRCKQLDDHMMALIYGLKMKKDKLCCGKDGKIFMVSLQDVFYFEGVDNKVFVYCEKVVYETKYKLYELESKFENTDFFRASKSSIINLQKIVNISPIFNGRFEALLSNQEKVIISRQYVPKLKEKLGL